MEFACVGWLVDAGAHAANYEDTNNPIPQKKKNTKVGDEAVALAEIKGNALVVVIGGAAPDKQRCLR